MQAPALTAPTLTATRPQVAAPAAALNALSIDVEEYFHAEVFARTVTASQRAALPRRAAACLERLATLLARHETRATFFVLGDTVRSLAPLLRHLITQGHEIACHGDGHEHLSRLDAESLREDLRVARAKIEDHLGVTPAGYRAPTFSVTRRTAWALDVILDAGFEYDSSIFPVHHDRYGVPDAPTTPFYAIAPSGRGLTEFPPLTVNIGLCRLPVGGGGYLRLLPRAVLRAAIAWRQRFRQPTLLYLHPWELDPGQPRLPAGRLATWRHRVNLATTEQKLAALLERFRFDTVARVLTTQRARGVLPEFAL